ncbi:carbonate dehydratase [bacterium]|nr:carbonate dehydratase [bacterium]
MRTLKHLFEKNKAWAEKISSAQPGFFKELSQQQFPEYLWIGCSDSRVPANEIVGLQPGELFVHRNVANIVIHTDFNCLSVIEYAVEVLRVKNIIVCGHYGCGGVKASLKDNQLSISDNWLRHIREIAQKHETELSQIKIESERMDRLCELNIIEQVHNVCNTTIVEKAWSRNQPLAVHGWIYGLTDGLLHDLNVCTSSAEEMKTYFERK